jgi:hypothetical protein
LEIRNFARVLFPVSVAPRRMAMPFSSFRVFEISNQSLDAEISIKAP